MSRTSQALLLLSLLGLSACPTPADQALSNLAHPQDIALVCVDGRKGISGLVPVVGVCDTSRYTILGFVPNGELGDLAVVAVGDGGFVDQDTFIPGFTRKPVGGQPIRIVAGPDGAWVYMANVGTRSLDRMKVAKLALDLERQPLPGAPADVVITVSGDQQTAWLTLPESGEIVRVPIGADFGTLDPAALPITKTGGTPRHLAVLTKNDAPTAIYASHITVAAVSEINPESGDLVATIPFAPACSDGLDNDGDGLVDGGDPDCESIDGATEQTIVIEGDLPACADGVDNDGDGLVDFPDDPGCRGRFDGTEFSAQPACSDGLDNDGDGLVDLADPGCSEDPLAPSELPQCGDGEDNDGDSTVDKGGDGTLPDDTSCAPFRKFTGRERNAETDIPTTCNDGIDNDGDGLVDAAPVADGIGEDPDCATPWSNGEARPVCANGVDDDGDGLVDIEDPDCYARGGASEAPSGAAPASDLALSPNGRWLYVTDQSRGTVEVIDTEAGVHLDVNAREQDGDPVLATQHVTGIQLPGSPLSVAFIATTDTVDGGQVQTQSAFVSTSLGYVYVLDAEVADEVKHLQRGTLATSGRGAVTQPDLTIAGESFQQGLSVQSEFANLGAFSTSPADGRYYGIQLADSPREVRTESWSATHEGVILDSSDVKTGAILTADGLFHDPWADFCAAGIEPGDVLVIEPGYRVDCAAPGSAARWIGDRFEIPIVEVRADSLVLSPDGAIGVLDDLIDEEPTCGHAAQHRTFTTGASATPHPTCFPALSGYRVRAPRGTFVVLGGRSGFLHRVVNQGGVCVTDESLDPRLTGRAHQAALKEGATAVTCSLDGSATSLDDSLDLQPFTNFAFTLSVRPGCCTADDGTGAIVEDTPLDLRWRFNITSPLTPDAALGGALPQAVRTFEMDSRLYVVDQGLDAIRRYFTTSLGEGSLIF